MDNFNSEFHSIIKSADGSYTAYSKEYGEHYHSTKDGALHESLVKHVEPALEIKQKQKEINILDICFGLGFNTLATLYYHKKNALNSKLNIFSPELDSVLLDSLIDFNYPQEFDEFKHVVLKLVKSGVYSDANFHIELFRGNAREYIKRFDKESFDIVYQDAFSPSVNPILWTKEYFGDIKNIVKKDAILTTYSVALATRLALYENSFNLYINTADESRDSTVASLIKLKEFIHVDMEHKILCNPHVKPLRD